MLTQQELIDRLNQLTLRYNLSWFDIKYDADKAINKINVFLGTKYPKLSEYLKTPTDTYSIKQDKVDELGNLERIEYEIIKEEYFHSIIIPYIASEILARDEEFTTIYNKYLLEMQEGMFDMFQREFNKVPFDFRQNPDEGVFFAVDTALGQTQHNQRNLNVPTFKFHINYFPNENNIILTSQFPIDNKAYVYDEIATIVFLDSTIYFYSNDGTTAYLFDSWGRDRTSGFVTGSNYKEGILNTIKMRSDVSLYAIWSKSNVLNINSAGVVSINTIHRPNLVNLVIPERVNAVEVKQIPTYFILGPVTANPLDPLRGLYLPSGVIELQQNSLQGFQGDVIKLNEGLLTIRTNSFANTPNLKEIIIPSTVITIEANAFPVVAGKHLVIKTRVLEINKPVGWVNGWYANSTSNYSVEIIWGYNGS
jgi:hypothetical protein